MNFLPDVYVTCDLCRGRRYNRETLQVKFKGYSIADLLEATVEEALPLMENLPQINAKLQTLYDVGLGYVHLGQSATTLSGGEAQRIKLAKELSKRQTGRTFYLLDEPTTGLHFDDVRKLLDVVQRLVGLGNTVVVIEHNLDVIKTADWIVDMGPEGGDGGGTVVVAGTPEDVAAHPQSHTGHYLRRILAS
jgi:excinuclease ABC subunit A